MDIEHARALAAQCWCTPKTSHKEMDVELAEEFASVLVAVSTEAVGTRKPFQQELTALINSHCRENGSNTPDFILAEYMNTCLHAFDDAVTDRERWHGREVKPVKTLEDAVKEARGGEAPPVDSQGFA